MDMTSVLYNHWLIDVFVCIVKVWGKKKQHHAATFSYCVKVLVPNRHLMHILYIRCAKAFNVQNTDKKAFPCKQTKQRVNPSTFWRTGKRKEWPNAETGAEQVKENTLFRVFGGLLKRKEQLRKKQNKLQLLLSLNTEQRWKQEAGAWVVFINSELIRRGGTGEQPGGQSTHRQKAHGVFLCICVYLFFFLIPSSECTINIISSLLLEKKTRHKQNMLFFLSWQKEMNFLLSVHTFAPSLIWGFGDG